MATTTKFWTWLQIYNKITTELDLGEEDFVSKDEMREYANDAIKLAEAAIHSLAEDYFLTFAPMTIASGTDTYALPANIYGSKIRNILYYDSAKVYEVKRCGILKKFMELQVNALYAVNTGQVFEYHYFLINSTSGAPQILMTPPVKDSGALLKCWYLRNANRLETDGDVCDIPEFISVIFNFIRERITFKEEPGSPKHQKAQKDFEDSTLLMMTTLKDMVVDGANEIEPDYSHYEESV